MNDYSCEEYIRDIRKYALYDFDNEADPCTDKMTDSTHGSWQDVLRSQINQTAEENYDPFEHFYGISDPNPTVRIVNLIQYLTNSLTDAYYDAVIANLHLVHSINNTEFNTTYIGKPYLGTIDNYAPPIKLIRFSGQNEKNAISHFYKEPSTGIDLYRSLYGSTDIIQSNGSIPKDRTRLIRIFSKLPGDNAYSSSSQKDRKKYIINNYLSPGSITKNMPDGLHDHVSKMIWSIVVDTESVYMITASALAIWNLPVGSEETGTELLSSSTPSHQISSVCPAYNCFIKFAGSLMEYQSPLFRHAILQEIVSPICTSLFQFNLAKQKKNIDLFITDICTALIESAHTSNQRIRNLSRQMYPYYKKDPLQPKEIGGVPDDNIDFSVFENNPSINSFFGHILYQNIETSRKRYQLDDSQ